LIHRALARRKSAFIIIAVLSGMHSAGALLGFSARYAPSVSAKSDRIGCRSSRRCLEYAARIVTAGGSLAKSKLPGVKLLSSFARKPVPTATR
jgi:hypothetical protein